jgi:23S rRNA pseudouridine1911/1915/1917 synthase
MSRPLTVLWEDPHGLAVDKPAGWLTQGPVGGELTLESLVRLHLRPDDPASAYVGTVHRLDRPVSGVILWAKTPKAARRWADQFARREARKEYWAIVEGNLAGPGETGVWEDWLGPPGAQGRARVIDPSEPGAVRASTRFEVGRGLAVREGFTWLKLRPETGRTHQLRVQASARLGPIVGDATYGSIHPFPSGIALHARSLTIEHPVHRRSITIEAPLPGSWEQWLADRSFGSG